MTFPSATPCPTPNLTPYPTPNTTPCPTPRLRKNNSSRWISGHEARFLHAVEVGDVSMVKRLLDKHPDLNVDCTDDLGRTPLRLAVKNENKELVEILLALSSPNNIHEALLQAIDAGSTTIAETTLRHPRFVDMESKRRRMGDTDGFFKPERGSQFPSYVTPLNLAAQKEEYVIVKLLLQRGETIAKPHKFACSCQECINKNKFDQLRSAQCRLDAYRGLASEAYISLNYQDPILTAMELASELKKQAKNELYFKIEYNNLADQLSLYMVKLLDRIWTHHELDVVLDKTGAPWEDSYESLARLKLALEYEEKKFVAHPNCQQRIVQRWRKGTGPFTKAPWTKKLIIICLSCLAFPFAVLVFLVRPHSKFANFLRLPTVKFLSHTISFFIFLALIIYSSTEMMGIISSSNTLLSHYPNVHAKYTRFRNETGRFACGPDFPVRAHHPTVTEFMISIWVVALIVQECQELWTAGLVNHSNEYYNWMDFILLSVYTATYTIRYWLMYKLHWAVHYFETEPDVTKDPILTEYNIYWLNADRRFWRMTDPTNMVEGLFAMANILSFTRISYLLPANETLGPLQISLGRMVNDIINFMALAVLAIIAFMVALRNLFWYYAVRHDIEMNPNQIEDPTAVKFYGSELATFRTVFWAIYGRGGTRAVSLGGYNNTVTEGIGEGIDIIYHMTMIILFVNIFIAMMTRSYEQIAADEDVEWKFARSSLYMNYISEARLLPVPLNILEIPHAIVFHHCTYLHQIVSRPIQKVRKSFKRTRRPALVPTKSSKEKVQRFLEENDGTEMGKLSSRSTPACKKRQGTVTSKYEEVMHRIVHRYIMDVMRENEVGGYVEELRGSFDLMRTEVFTNWKQKDENVSIAKEAMFNIAHDLSKMAEGEDTNELENLCSALDWWSGMRGTEPGPESGGYNSDDNVPKCSDDTSTISSFVHHETVHEQSSEEAPRDKIPTVQYLGCDDFDVHLKNDIEPHLPFIDDENERNGILDEIIGYFDIFHDDDEEDDKKEENEEDKDDGIESETSSIDNEEEDNNTKRREEVGNDEDKTVLHNEEEKTVK